VKEECFKILQPVTSFLHLSNVTNYSITHQKHHERLKNTEEAAFPLLCPRSSQISGDIPSDVAFLAIILLYSLSR
jgi:hypothetical protein